MNPIPMERPRPGILLTNVGSPDAPTTSAVRRFLDEFLADPLVVDAQPAIWWLLRKLIILPFRSPRSARLYRSVWTTDGSPLLVTGRRQAEGLGAELERRTGQRISVTLGMRYGYPSLQEGLRELAGAGCNRVLVVPLFPQYSRTTVGTTVAAVQRANAGFASPLGLRTIEGYSTHRTYVEALANSVREARLTERNPGHLVVSFHGLPRRYAEAGDPYPDQCEATADRLASELGLASDSWTMSYQSQFGREEWLGPSTDSVLRGLGGRDGEPVFVICPGFAADCLETLEEVAASFRRLFLEAGGRGFHYVPALNDRPDHIAALADLVQSALTSWEGSMTLDRSTEEICES